jgi:hypothetical protein
MIQLLRYSSSAPSQNFVANLYDKMTSTEYTPLVLFVSQLTGKRKIFISEDMSLTHKERYIRLSVKVNYQNVEDLEEGIIYLGNSDFPYGFYDVTIYQNSSATNLDPSSLTTIYTGLMNLKQSGNAAITYTEYTTNDSDTESVYITNTV